MALHALQPMIGQGVLAAPRRYLALFLPRWATDCLKRAEPALQTSTRPLALWEKQRSSMRLVAVDERAAAEGLIVGMPLADAKGLVPHLTVREIDRAYTARVFSDFADWHSNASPLVSVLTDLGEWGDLVLDITGVSHLFGGEAAMLSRLMARLETLGLAVTGAIAPTIGGAWALAHYGGAQVVGDGLNALLAPLPVAALRLTAAQCEGLHQLGLKRIGQLYGRDRRGLQARFGESLLAKLDQALGYAEERLVPRLPVTELYMERRFAEPIGLIDDVLMTVRDLALQLADRLGRDGQGAQAFHLFLYRVDHKVMTLSVNAARATRDAAHIARLFVHRAERLEGEYDAGFGIDTIRLAAGSLAALGETQIGAFETDDGAASLDQLYDRMTSRLGPLAVLRTEMVDSHIPERAVRLTPVIASTVQADAPPVIAAPRPLRLLPQPEPINVLAEVPDAPPVQMVWRRVTYRFVKASGPERIGVEWWQAGQPLALTGPAPPAVPGGSFAEPYSEGEQTRDYYIAEDDGGRRFWIFRQGLFGLAAAPRWYLQGVFA